MRNQYFYLEDQDEDWNPVLKKFTSDMLLEGMLDMQKSSNIFDYGMGGKIKFLLTEQAADKGFESPKDLWNYWYNKQREETIKNVQKTQE